MAAAFGANGVASSSNHQHHGHSLHLGHSHKATGYAFSLNLCRSLGLWAQNAPFPSNIQKPQYLPLNPSNQSVDWDELLRKFSKHNSSQAAHVVAASTRLELLIWRALQAQNSSKTYNAQPMSRETSISQANGLASNEAVARPQEFQIESTTQKKNIELQRQELQKVVTLAGLNTAETASHIVVLALAFFSIGKTSESAQILGVQQGTAPFNAAPDAPTHELDLQILGVVLKGLLQEHAGQTEIAITTYRSLPCSPPPPVPEAQRYIEVGLSRLAELQRDSSSLEAHRNYLALTSSFTNVSPHKRLNVYTTYLSTLLARIAEYYNAEHSPHTNQATTNPPDTSDLFTTFKSYENLLQSSPSLASFPRAGEPTLNMIQYLDLLYGFWRYSLLPSEWVVESLNRCFTKTYANQKLLRCLVFVLATMSFSSSDRPKARKWAIDALKNMRLYIGLFEKTRETDQAAIKREINAFRKRTQGENGSTANSASQSTSDEQEEKAEVESDENFCYVCCIGTRLLLWESVQDNLQEQEDARLDLITEALEVITKAKTYMDNQAGGAIDGPRDSLANETANKDRPITSDPPRLGPQGRLRSEVARQRSEVEAEVLLWLGVAKVESALAEADLEQGKSRAKEALSCLSSAAQSVPAVNPRDEDAENSHRASLRTRSLYSLAYSHLELRDVASALPIAKKAVESLHQQELGVPLEASDLRVWHLFVLILTAMKDWRRAKEVVELALYGWSDFNAESNTHSSPEPLSSVPTFVRQKSGAVTRGDAPYDPAAIGGAQPVTQHTQDRPSAARVSFDQATGANGGEASSTPSFATPQGSSEHGSRRAGSSPLSRKHGVGRFVTQKLTSDWDDLEAEIELLITRNRCIEAIEGPEYALQDLQRTVFTRFSKRREELEAGSSALQAIVALSPEPTSPQGAKTSTYPYASKDMRNKVPNVQFQQDGTASDSNTPSRARSIIGSISLRHRSHSIKKTNTTQSQASGRLAVPPETGRPASIASTVSANPSYEDVNAQTSPRAPSIATNIEGSGSDTPSSGPQARVQRHHPRAARLLSKLWLTSAASFRRWGKYSECLGAINEAEDVAGNVDPDVWVQYAQYLTTSTGDLQNERAQLALQKAFAISTDHIPTVLTLSRIRIDAGDWAIAEGFLDVATQTNAWDSPEAWYLLAKVYEKTKRQKRARECLLYALDLEETRPIRELRHTLDRYL